MNTKLEIELTNLIRQAQQELLQLDTERKRNIEEWFVARKELTVLFKTTAKVLSEVGFESSCLLYNGGIVLRANKSESICSNIIVTPDFDSGCALWEESGCDNERMSLPLNNPWWEFRLIQFARKVASKS